MMGKVEGRRKSGQKRMKCLDGIIKLNGHEFEQTLGDIKDREAQCAAVHGAAKSWMQLNNNNHVNEGKRKNER